MMHAVLMEQIRMRRRPIAWLRVLLLLAGIVAWAAPESARATIQEDSCIYPDVEYPLPCDDDE